MWPATAGALVGNDNALVRAVARMPWRVRSKLLLAFVGIVAMFVVVGILGLRTLSQSNARVEQLGTLQLRAAAYRELQTGAAQLRQLLALRAGGDITVYIGGQKRTAPTRANRTFLDQTIATTLLRLGPATDSSESRLRAAQGGRPHPRSHPHGLPAGFPRPRQDHRLRRSRGRGAGPKAPTRPGRAAGERARGAREPALRCNPSRDDRAHRREPELVLELPALFIVAGVASVVLALLLGSVLAWSVGRPYPEDRGAPGGDRLGGLLQARRRPESRRARRARGEPQPDERRARTAVRAARVTGDRARKLEPNAGGPCRRPGEGVAGVAKPRRARGGRRTSADRARPPRRCTAAPHRTGSPAEARSRACGLRPGEGERDPRRAWTPKSRRRWTTFATSRTVSTRRCSRTAGSQTRLRRRRSERRLLPASRRTGSVAIRPISRRLSTSVVWKRFRTPRSTRAMPPQLRFECAGAVVTLPSTSATTAPASTRAAGGRESA